MKKLLVLQSIMFSIVWIITVTPSVQAQQTKPITLKYAFYYGLKHPQGVPNVTWAEKMEKETNGRLKIKFYPGGSLMSPRESYEELKNGVADLTTINVGFSPHGFDVHKGIVPFFYGFPDTKTRLKIFKNDIITKFPEIMDEFKETKIVRFGTMEFQLFSKKPARTVEDLKGMSIKSMGHYAYFIKGCGGEGIPLPMSETYIALQKGTVDGLLSPFETLATFKFAEVTPYVTLLNLTQTPFPTEAMNLDTWNKLPVDIQKIITDSQEWWENAFIESMEAANEKGLEFAKQKGVEFITPSSQALSKFYQALEKVCLNSAKQLDDLGFHGTDIYKEIRRQAEKALANP